MLPVPQVAVRGCCADLRCGHLPSCSSSRSLQPHGRGSRSAPSCSSPSRCVRLGRRKTMVLKRAASTSHPLLTPCITDPSIAPLAHHPARAQERFCLTSASRPTLDALGELYDRAAAARRSGASYTPAQVRKRASSAACA